MICCDDKALLFFLLRDALSQVMKRRETSDEREAQLDAWDRRLEDRQRELDAAIIEFRTEVKRETARLLEREEQLLQRAKDLSSREEIVAHREDAVLEALEKFSLRIDQTHRKLSSNNSATTAASPEGKESQLSPPRAAVPKISGLAGLSGGTAFRGPPVQAPSSSVPRGTVSTTRPTNTSPEHVDPAYEGPVDRTVESHVEVLPSDGSSSTPTPRGLRASPQFKAMDPNDSGLFFFRGGHRRESFRELRGVDARLQEQFDLAIEYLLGNGLLTEEQVEDILGQSSPESVIELYQAYLAENAAVMEDDGEEEVEELGDEIQYDEEDGEDDDNFDENAPPQFYARHEDDDGDNAADNEEDDDPRRRRFRETHDDDEEEQEEDESHYRSSAHNDSGHDQHHDAAAGAANHSADPVIEGTSSPNPADKHVFDDFDDD